MLKLHNVLLSAVFFSILFSLPVQAEISAPENAVVLTVVGDIGESNRPPFDAQRDYFFKAMKIDFQQAVAFDYAMLEALGMQKIRLGMADWEQPYDFEGPSLQALLAAVGVEQPTLVTITALDGYKMALDQALLNAHDWTLMIKREGRYFGVGDMGPAWLVFTPKSGDAVPTKEETALWPWASFIIEVKK